ncbi:MAG TPA: glucose 1-dehydrogenase [Acidimicrobiales bacterium]|jgi:NAD(P)-dependent dehydrogenase (short-subunit alcohol dehydrogenase family)
MPSFDGKVAIVTGAANGIGQATAAAFASRGASVLLADIDVERGEAVVTRITDDGGTASFVRADVSNAADVKAMVDAAVERYGRLDYAHNNAGIVGGGATVVDMPEETWNQGIGVMLTGVFLCLKYEIPAILEQSGGAIVNTSSGAGIIGFPTMANYVAAKHGVIGLTKTAALEYATSGIRINAVCPGTARSKMVDDWIGGDPAKEAEVAALHPIGRIAEAEEIANAVLWLCSDAASFMIGHAMVVDGGYTIQ